MTTPNCELCGEPMPEGEEMFKFHGYSGQCPKPPMDKGPSPAERLSIDAKAEADMLTILREHGASTLLANVTVDRVIAIPAAEGGLYACVREWQEARKPTTLPEPGAGLVEAYRAAVTRMAAADEALAAYDLNGPAGGALVGQAAPTESTGALLSHRVCAICGCGPTHDDAYCQPRVLVNDVVDLAGFGLRRVSTLEEADVCTGNDGVDAVYRPIWKRPIQAPPHAD